MQDNPHDAFFKLVFSDPEHAAGELRAILPPELAARIRWDTLAPRPGSFVDEDLARSHTDLLFAAQLAGREALLYFLFEHLSTAKHLVPFRLLSYQVRIWQDFLARHPHARKLPPILPIVLHHSAGGWQAETSFEALLDIDPELLPLLARHLPRFTPLLDDISHATDSQLRRRAMTALGKLALICLRDARKSGLLWRNLGRYADLFGEVLAAPNGIAAAGAVLKYIARTNPRLPIDQLRHTVRQIVQKEAHMETMEDELEEYYGKRGIVRGHRDALLRQLRKRFGALPSTAVDRVKAADLATLETWLDRVLTAPSLDDIWAES